MQTQLFCTQCELYSTGSRKFRIRGIVQREPQHEKFCVAVEYRVKKMPPGAHLFIHLLTNDSNITLKTKIPSLFRIVISTLSIIY